MSTANAPRVGCGAAILRDGRLLLVKRRRPPEPDHWGLPGGKVDFLETVPSAVIREIDEELGVRIGKLALLCVVDQIDPAAGTHWVAPVYRAEILAGDPAVREPEALSAAGWFALDALPEPLTLSTRTALPYLRG
jgi:ADP-ribose pyrophosphatase YjhB (NUDIX family)